MCTEWTVVRHHASLRARRLLPAQSKDGCCLHSYTTAVSNRVCSQFHPLNHTGQATWKGQVAVTSCHVVRFIRRPKIHLSCPFPGPFKYAHLHLSGRQIFYPWPSYIFISLSSDLYAGTNIYKPTIYIPAQINLPYKHVQCIPATTYIPPQIY